MKESNLKIEKVELQIVEQTTSTSAYSTAYEDPHGFHNVDYAFTRKGTYVVHVLLNNDYGFTYRVKVSK
jgi:hypothetical protein